MSHRSHRMKLSNLRPLNPARNQCLLPREWFPNFNHSHRFSRSLHYLSSPRRLPRSLFILHLSRLSGPRKTIERRLQAFRLGSAKFRKLRPNSLKRGRPLLNVSVQLPQPEISAHQQMTRQSRQQPPGVFQLLKSRPVARNLSRPGPQLLQSRCGPTS